MDVAVGVTEGELVGVLVAVAAAAVAVGVLVAPDVITPPPKLSRTALPVGVAVTAWLASNGRSRTSPATGPK